MVTVQGEGLSTEDVSRVARRREKATLAASARKKMEASRSVVEELGRGGSVAYGIKTGLGRLATVSIPSEEIRRLQVNVLRSHAAGVGPPLEEGVVRAMALVRANGLAKGYSGVRPAVVESLLEIVNRNVYPYIPSKGSVGTSGDLQPLAHLALLIIGEGSVMQRGKPVPVARLKKKPVRSLELQAKEALALINGTSLMAAIGSLAVEDSLALLKNAVVAGAMSFEALRGSPKPFDPRLMAARPYHGQAVVAASLRRLLKGSEIVKSHMDEKKDPRVQDAYSLRCMPQVLGSAIDVVRHVKSVVEVDLNSATDNPLVFPDSGEAISGGNFHGQPLAMALDYLGLAMTVVGSFSERRIARLVDGHLSGLPPFLTEQGGLNSGFMIAQYTAAALASENKVLAHPASADSIPTSANQEDYVCMGPHAGAKARQIIENAATIVAIEVMCAAQGLEFLKPLRPGRGVAVCYEAVRRLVLPLAADRPLDADIEKVKGLMMEGGLIAAAERAVDPPGLLR